MANQHSPDKEVLGFYIPRELAQKVRKAARTRKLTITAFVEEVLLHATRNTELSPQDYHAIAEATQRAINGQAAKNARRASEKSGKGSKKTSE